MKKIFSILLVICMAISMCACASNNSIDNEIIKTSNAMLEEWGLEEGRTFSVTIDNDEIYHVDINGYELLVKVEKAQIEYIQKSNISECNSKVLDIVLESRNKVTNYINNSNILKDKEELIEYISNVPVQVADFSDEEAAAEYDLKVNTIFINSKHIDAVCEWMIVHELVHALAHKTNGGVENERYPYALFNEVLTDIITAAMEPKIFNDGVSKYSTHYQWVHLYLGCVGIKGIEAYFYGYDEILSKIPETELDIFVESLEQVDSSEDAIIIICNCINDWGLEK